MNLKNLDLDTIRTLIVANDLGGYGQAANRLGRTPSAVSLQMKRLQEDVGAVLFRKHGRGLALTEAGDLVLRLGRQMLALNDELLDTLRGTTLTGHIRLGFSQDFADGVLPAVLARFVKQYPRVVLELRIEGNAALAAAQRLGQLELVWIAGRGFSPPPDQPLPLVLLGPQCAFRKEAVSRLDAAGLAWRVAATSPSLAGLWASALGGLGVTVRSRLALPDTLVVHRRMFELPELAPFPVTLHAQPHETSQSIDRLRAIIRDVVAEWLPKATPGRARRAGAPARPHAAGALK